MTSWPNAANPGTPERPSVLPAAVRAAHDERLVAAVESLVAVRMLRNVANTIEKLPRVLGRSDLPEVIEGEAQR